MVNASQHTGHLATEKDKPLGVGKLMRPSILIKEASRLQCREGESWRGSRLPAERTELRIHGGHVARVWRAEYWEKRAAQRETLEISRVPPWVFSCICNSIFTWANTLANAAEMKTWWKLLHLLPRQKWESQELSPNK